VHLVAQYRKRYKFCSEYLILQHTPNVRTFHEQTHTKQSKVMPNFSLDFVNKLGDDRKTNI
jgi:hypothetical protein